MNGNNGMMELAIGSWLVALAAGTLAGTMLWLMGGWGFMQGLFAGVVIFLVLGAVISWIMTRPLPRPGEVKPGAIAAKAPVTRAAPVKVQPAPTVARVQPTKYLPGQADLAARKGSWKYEKPAAAPAPAPAAPAKAATPDLVGRPAHLSDAPDGAPDDLKRISGVGPKLEQTLNELGIWHFEQIANFTKDDVAWVDERLRFKGRIERDDWIGQARELAKSQG